MKYIRENLGMTMKRLFFGYFITFFIPEFSESKLMQRQLDFLTVIIKDLQVKQFMLLSNSVNKTHSEDFFPIIKILSKMNTFSTLLSVEEFSSTVRKIFDHKMLYSKTMILINTDDFNKIFSTTNFKNEGAEHFVAKFTWIIFENPEIISKKVFKKNDSDCYIPYNCEFLIVETLNDATLQVNELYDTVRSSKASVIMKNFGIWAEENSLQIQTRDLYQRRFNLYGSAFGVLSEYSPLTCHIIPIFCIYGEIIEDIALMMNFSYYYFEPKTEAVAAAEKLDIPIEILMATYIMNSIREVPGMVGPIFKTPFFLYIKYDDSMEGNNFSIYLRPFTFNTWLSIITWFLLSTVCHLYINYLIHRITTKLRSNSFRNASYFSRVLSFLNQGLFENTESTSYRIATYMSSLLTLVIVSSYCGVITSLLVIRIIKLPFEDFDGLVKDGTYKIMLFQSDTFLIELFEQTKDPAIRMANEKHLIDFQDKPGCYKHVLESLCGKSKYAVVDNDDKFLLQENKKCEILKIPTSFYDTWNALRVRRGSPYQKIFNRILKTFRSAGILKKLEILTYPKILNNDELIRNSPDSMELRNITSLIEIIATMYLFSVVILFVEIFIARKKKIQKKRKRRKELSKVIQKYYNYLPSTK